MDVEVGKGMGVCMGGYQESRGETTEVGVGNLKYVPETWDGERPQRVYGSEIASSGGHGS